jgi:uncharacterized protein with ParB-like and HNH nuclease domain
MKRIDANARTIRELLDGAKFSIDSYQREYAWKERQIQELIDDLTGKFLGCYDPNHSRHEIAKYEHYFLGSIVISNKDGQRFIVDGQQRLTSLTLLLIFLHHRQKNEVEPTPILNLIHSMRFGQKSFNIEVPERTEAVKALLEAQPPKLDGASESVRNIADRYDTILDHFPEEIEGAAVVYFVDWLLENVYLVEIEAFSDEDAYTIFETMNDRGLPLSLPEMLKGYILAKITHEPDQNAVNALWKARMHELKQLGGDEERDDVREDIDFFKNWLRACHAETIRPGKKGAENKDYERIGTEFHRWVREPNTSLKLKTSDDFVRFVKRDLDFYARQTLAIRKAARQITPGWESIRYNEDRGFTLQTQVILAALTPDDPEETTRRKVAMVADFLDIWLARRAWNFRTTSYSSVKYTVFILTKELRGRNLAELSGILRKQLDNQPERFATQPRYRLHQQNYRQVRHILARLTHWVDTRCGLHSHFEDLISQGSGRPFEIEHIWANHPDDFPEHFKHPSDFEEARNRLGGLLLLQRGLNQSLGDASYEDKRDAYLGHSQNLLARSLHPGAYQNNPSFKKLMADSGLVFRDYETFGPDEQAERQELYLRLAEWVWNPSRLDLDGEKPPVHDPIGELNFDDEENTSPAKEGNGTPRGPTVKRFFTQMLLHSVGKLDLHGNISATQANWVGARKHGQWWNYVVTQDATRAELYIDNGKAEDNKALFDHLFAHKVEIETAFGASLFWQRLDDKRASRISFTVPGGWADETSWPGAIEKAVDAMKRLYAAAGERVKEFVEKY